MSQLYRDYRDEEKRNLWDSYEGLASFTSDSEVVQRYIDSEFGSNEIYKYRVLAIFHHMEELHQIVYGAARELLADCLESDDVMALYFDEMQQFSLLRKQDFLNYDAPATCSFHFDFVALSTKNFSTDPKAVYVPEGLVMEIFHTGRQKQMIKEWIQQHGTHVNGLGRLISRAQVSALYRQVRLRDIGKSFQPKWRAEQLETLTGKAPF